MAGDLIMMLTDDPERTFELVKDQLAWRYNTYNAYSAMGSGEPAPPPIDVERWRPGSTPGSGQPGFAPLMYHIVTPKEAIQRVQQLVDTGYPIEDVHLYCISGVPDEVTEHQIELVCDQLVPAVARMTNADAS